MFKNNSIKIMKICLILLLFFVLLTGFSISKKHKLKEKISQAEPSFASEIYESSSIEASQKSLINEQSHQKQSYASEKESLSQRIETLKSKVSKYSEEKANEDYDEEDYDNEEEDY